MTKTRGPPRRPNQATTAGQTTEPVSSGSEPANIVPQSRGYRLIAAQQPSAPAPSSSEALRYPPPAAAAVLPRPTTSAPSAPINTQTAQPIDPHIGDQDPLTEPSFPPPADLIGDESATLAEYPYSIYNHGTWTADDDRTLIQARTRGQNWADLQRTHFPTKTANACRKRYERLVERRGIHDYGGRRLEMVAGEYMNLRREIWSGLAERVGMKWEVVEALCMGAGLRTIQSNARSYTNRARRDNRVSQKTRDAQADVPSVGAAVPLPMGTEFGTAFNTGPGRPPDQGRYLGLSGEAGDRSSTSLMPPPPFIPTSGPAPTTTRLPPMVLAPPMPFPAYIQGDERLPSVPTRSAGLAPEPPPTRRARDGQTGHRRGPG